MKFLVFKLKQLLH